MVTTDDEGGRLRWPGWILYIEDVGQEGFRLPELPRGAPGE